MVNKGKIKVAPKRFGAIVREKREKLDLSQEDFAEKVGIHRTYVSDIELGKVDISLTVASKIASAFKIPLSKLIKQSEK